jgi:hypothetical protein
MRSALHYAITAHGLGHFTRSMLILEAVHKLRQDLELHVSTSIDAPWIQRQLDIPISWRHFCYEPGALQKNPFEVDEPATIDAYAAFALNRAELLASEIEFLRQHRFVGVVSDCPALAVRAAAEVGLPAIGISNFTWDWILEPWIDPQSSEAAVVAALREDYASGSSHLVLPFGQKESPFPSYEASVLVGRRAILPRDVVRARLGVEGRVALVSPGGWSGEGWPEIQARAGKITLITIGDLPVQSDSPIVCLANNLPDDLTFPDVVNAADVVIAKPGFGLASECLIHRVPFVMIERPNFRETPALQAQFGQMGQCSTLGLADFFNGNWEHSIEAAFENRQVWVDLDSNPEAEIASRLLDLLGL